MGERREIGVGVVGLGFMGRTHVGAYRDANAAGHANRLVAVCDQDERRRRGEASEGGNIVEGSAERLFDPDDVHACATLDELLADTDVELISVCTPSDTHVDVALAALDAGKHVLVEKPVALSAAGVRRVADAARAADRVAMPAMCMRFWPGWDWLKARIDDGSLGAVRSAAFTRLGAMPGWAGFYQDFAKSGGALGDLHLHDADFVRWCFGAPRAVRSFGTLMHVTTGYQLDDGPAHATAEGGWDLAPSFPFTMRYVVVFERATAYWDLARDPLLTVHEGDETRSIDLEPITGWDGEIRHLLDVLALGAELRATMDDAAETMRLIEAERRSLETGRPVELAEVE